MNKKTKKIMLITMAILLALIIGIIVFLKLHVPKEDRDIMSMSGFTGAEAETTVAPIEEKPVFVPVTEDIVTEPVKTYGDEGVDFVSDETHFVYSDEENVYHVYSYEDNAIYAHVKYTKLEDEETALQYLDVLNEIGVFAYPEVREVYAKNEYVITVYNDTEWMGMSVPELKLMYFQYELRPEGVADLRSK